MGSLCLGFVDKAQAEPAPCGVFCVVWGVFSVLFNLVCCCLGFKKAGRVGDSVRLLIFIVLCGFVFDTLKNHLTLSPNIYWYPQPEPPRYLGTTLQYPYKLHVGKPLTAQEWPST